jgi:hypothetical protein
MILCLICRGSQGYAKYLSSRHCSFWEEDFLQLVSNASNCNKNNLNQTIFKRFKQKIYYM